MTNKKQKNITLPKISGNRLRIIPLGGLGEVGKNCTIFEYGNDIIIIDLGLMFPDEEMPGIDYVIPDVTYLKENAKKIRGLLITHGHLDHTGAIPYVLPRIGNPTIYTRRLTAAMIRGRLKEFKLAKKAKVQIIKDKEKVRLGQFQIEFFHVNHSIHDASGVVIRTPIGNITYTGDFKFDESPVGQEKADLKQIAAIGQEGVLALFGESTNAEEAGHSIPEREIADNLDKMIGQAPGRVILATFASLLSRFQQAIASAERYNRRIAFIGRSLTENVRIAKELKYLKVPGHLVLPVKKIKQLPPKQAMILTTGSQGEQFAGLPRIVRGEHPDIKIQAGDTVIISASAIPGNERSINRIIDSLYRLGAKPIYNTLFDVHSGGHGRQEDIKEMVSLIKPKYYIPIHGERRMREANKELIKNEGIPANNIFVMENGQALELTKDSAAIAKESLPDNYVMVDGLGVGDIGQVVLRDRQTLAQDGMFIVIMTLDNKTGQLVTSPDIISRGFIYMKESEQIVGNARKKVRQIVRQKKSGQPDKNWAYLKSRVRDDLGQYLFKKTERRPMIIPVVIEV